MRVLLAFDTGRGVICARTSGWQRVYLLWTFRNFRSLPQKTLNSRQQELVATLYRSSVMQRAREFDDGVIGTVEEFRLPSSPPDCVADQRLACDHAGKTLADLQSFKSAAQFYARPAFSPMTLRIGDGALLVLVAAFAWYQMRAQSTFTARTTARAVAAVRAATAGSELMASMGAHKLESPAAPLPPPTTIQTASAEPSTMASTAATSPPALSAVPSARASSLVPGEPAPHGRAVSVHHVPGAQGTIPPPEEQHRMLISGRPRKLVYPVCPDTSERGKVSLRAVIDHNGGVSQVQVLAGSRALAAAAIAAVRQWSYPPFSKDIPMAERETNITVSFISSEVVAISFPDPAFLGVPQTTANAAQR